MPFGLTLQTMLIPLFTLAAEGDGGPPQAPPPGQGEQLVLMIGMLVPLGLVFWLLIWRPEAMRKQKRQQLMMALKVKDKVVTIGGIYGTVVSIDKDEVTLQVDPKKDVKMRVRRSSVESIDEAKAKEKK